jgi:hypothetical protein
MFTFADDISVIIYHHEKNHFWNWIYDAFAKLNKCFQANTSWVKFWQNNYWNLLLTCISLNLDYSNKTIE